MHRAFSLSLVCLLGAAGCGGGGGDEKGPTVPTSDVTGTLVDIHVTEAGDVANPLGASEYAVAALYWDAEGVQREIVGIGSNDGTFLIPAVPEGPYDLKFIEYYGEGTLPPRYVMNAPRSVDLGRVYAGRPDASPITTSPTEIRITATGLSAWSDSDDLELFSLGAGSQGSLVPTNGMPPAAGATSLSNYAVDTAALARANIVDGAAGDTAVVTQLVTQAGATAAYRSVRTAFAMPSFTQSDGGSVDVSGAFAGVTDKSFSVEIDDMAFQALLPIVNPLAESGGRDLRITAEPGGDRATASPTPTLLALKSGATGALPSKFVYGNPFGLPYSEVVSVGYVYLMTHTMPTGIPKQTAVLVGTSGAPTDFKVPVAPMLGPPLDIRVNDQPASGDLMGIGQAPKISWSPPAIGTPAVYIVALRRLDPGGATTKTMALFSTTETSLRLPADLLDYGYYYYVRVSVRSEFDLAVPFKGGTKTSFAVALSGVLSP